MHPSDDVQPGRNNLAITYDTQQAMDIIDRLKADGIPKGDIHVVGKDLIEFSLLKWDAEVNLHRIGNPGDKLKSFFTGEDAEIGGLKLADLPKEKLEHYKQIVDGGGVIIFTDEYLDTTKIVNEIERDPNVIDDSKTFEEGPRY